MKRSYDSAHRARLSFAALALGLGLCAVACKPNEGATKDSGSSSTPASSTDAKPAPLGEMSVDDVDKRIAANDAKFAVFDANDKETFAAGHVPGAKWVPSNAVTADMLPADKATTLVFYCANEH